MTFLRVSLAWCALFLVLSPGLAERKHDPLTSPEIDQLRDTAMDPDLRLKLYVTFARARLAALEQARSDPKTTDRSLTTHDGLQDFLDVYDELNDNIDTYVGRKSDLRKVLKLSLMGTPNSRPSCGPCETTPRPGRKRWSNTNSAFERARDSG